MVEALAGLVSQVASFADVGHYSRSSGAWRVGAVPGANGC